MTPWFLRQNDQKTIAALLVLFAIFAAVSTGWYAWQCGGLIQYEDRIVNEYSFQVNVNEADWPEISALPKIGEVMARRIVEYRKANGPFISIESLANVDGIGPKTIQSIRPFIAELLPSDEMVAESR